MGSKFQVKVFRSEDGLYINLPNPLVDEIDVGDTLLVRPQRKQIIIEKPWVPPDWVCP